jgi:hypothetical protein
MHACRGCTADAECATGFCSPATQTCRPGTITPKYLATICDSQATLGDLTIASDRAIDTSADAECTGGIVAQAGAPSIFGLHHGSITLTPGITVTVTGSRTLALVANDAVSINGTLDLGANGSADGPGGGTTASGGVATDGIGFGGAGFKTPGGSGGNTLSDGGAANPGAQVDVLSLGVLIGGPHAEAVASFGGGGGGAATFIACKGTVSIAGMVDAGGGVETAVR